MTTEPTKRYTAGQCYICRVFKDCGDATICVACLSDTRKIDELVHAYDRDTAALLEQLPGGMKNCTILFKECGHGWLTATNWVQHECQTCLRDTLTQQVAQLLDESHKDFESTERQLAALQARLDTAEREANEREIFYADVLNRAEDVRVEQRAKLAHLEGLVEGFEADMRKLQSVIRRHAELAENDLLGKFCNALADEVAAHIETALAALFTHRKELG